MSTTTPPPLPKRFPTQQLFVLSLCRICEPIAFCSIFPYVYYMVESFGTTKTPNEIAIYAGLVTSAFAFSEFATSMFWGRISDAFGRKPVLITGLFGTMVSMLLFGFAPSLPMALVARSVGGALNGNVGVIQTTVAEMVGGEREWQAKAFAVMPFVWCLGSIVGPALGGLLAEPTVRYPSVFPPGGMLEAYPYALPNLVAASVLAVGIVIGILFLEETHQVLRGKPDVGIRAGRKLTAFLSRSASSPEEIKHGTEAERLLPSQTGRGHPTSYSTTTTTIPTKTQPQPQPQPHRRASKTFTAPIIHQIISYGILAYHTMGFDQLFPVFLSTPPSNHHPNHPIKFTGGFGLSTQSIGFILSVQGVLSMAIQLWFFPPVVKYYGTLPVYRLCLLLFPVSNVLVPYLAFLPPSLAMTGVYAVLLLKITLGVMAYPCSAMLLTNAAPSMAVLGVINGVAASTASLCRALGPAAMGWVYARGLDMGVVGLAWWVNAGVCCFGGAQAFWMKEEDFAYKPQREVGVVVADEEAGSIAVRAVVEARHTTGQTI